MWGIRPTLDSTLSTRNCLKQTHRMTKFMNEDCKKSHRLENNCTLKQKECNDISKVEAKKRYLFIAAASFKLPFDRHSHWSLGRFQTSFHNLQQPVVGCRLLMKEQGSWMKATSRECENPTNRKWARFERRLLHKTCQRAQVGCVRWLPTTELRRTKEWRMPWLWDAGFCVRWGGVVDCASLRSLAELLLPERLILSAGYQVVSIVDLATNWYHFTVTVVISLWCTPSNCRSHLKMNDLWSDR